MAFNIDTFIGNGLTKGGARPSLFDVFVTFGPGIDVPVEALNKIRFTCRASSIPASTIAPINVPYFGRNIKLAGDRTFADWSVTVMNDEDYVVRNAFETWHNSINTIVSNRRVTETTGDYKGVADVRQYSKDGQTIIKEYKFVNIFPINLDEMALDWDATNQIQTFGATFAYDYWEPYNSDGTLTVNTVE
jgi:hypothetical protein